MADPYSRRGFLRASIVATAGPGTKFVSVLQNITGGFAIDSWSELTSGITAHTLVDDLQIFAVCTP